MKILNTFSLLIIAVTGAIAVGSHQVNQDPVPANKQQPKELEDRVENLERRVGQLESLIFSTAKLTVTRAERELDVAEARFKDSKELFNRGLLSATLYNNDRFLYEQALQELKLARTAGNQRRLANNLDRLKASQRAKAAQNNLKFKTKLFQKGYASKDQVDLARRDVEITEKELSIAESKLKIAEELDAVKTSDSKLESSSGSKEEPGSGLKK